MELNPEDTKTPEITLFEIINDEKRKENHVADQFFRSLLGFGAARRQFCRPKWIAGYPAR